MIASVARSLVALLLLAARIIFRASDAAAAAGVGGRCPTNCVCVVGVDSNVCPRFRKRKKGREE